MLINTQKVQSFDFSKTESQSFAIHIIRFVFLVVVFLITLSFQYLENRVIADGIYYPLFSLIFLSFVIQSTYLILFNKLYSKVLLTSSLFFFEALYITGLIYFIGVQQSILIFLYLVNLILFAVLFQRKAAMVLALWTSILFTLIVSIDTSLEGNTAYLAVGVNNLAFFTISYLAGFLSEQLNLVGLQLKEKSRDVRILKNLNEMILKNIKSGLITVDNQFNIIQANPQSLSLLGKTLEQIETVNLSHFFPELDSNNVSLEDFDYIYTRQGERRVFKMSLSELKDDFNLKQGLILSFTDETLLRGLETRVRQSEKMAAIGQLATGIAHEIRNPLAGISGSIQLLQSNSHDMEPEQTKKLMTIILREIDRLNHLITEFLDFAKPEAPMEDHIDLVRLFEDLIQLIQNDPKIKKIPIEIVSADKQVVLGNRDKLKQAFLNIIVNAVQACEVDEKAKVVITLLRKNQLILISIKDNGSGMKKELKERIFEPFYTTKPKGTGLGLAITHSIFESHKVPILVESELGQGTEFKLTFKALNQ